MRKVCIVRSFITLLVAVTAVAGLSVSIASAAPPIVVSMTFNGNTASQYGLAYQQALQPRSQHATFFTSSGTVGIGPGFMTWSQLADLQSGGNEIGGLTSHFTDLTTAPAQTARDEVCGDRRTMIEHGLNVSSFAYPYGAFNETAKDVVLRCGYGTARTAGGITEAAPNFAGAIPPADFLAVPAFAPPGAITLASLQSVVNGAAALGGWIPVVIQNVCSQSLDPGNYATCTNSGSHIELADLTAFLDWIAASGQAGGAPADTVLETVRQLVTAVDTIGPATTIACHGGPCTTDPYSGPVTVSLTATDLGSGVASIHYTTDGSEPDLSSPAYTGAFSQLTSGTIRFRSWDVTGNASPVGSQDLQIIPGPDLDPPVTTVTCNDAACASTAYTGPVSVALSATDGQGWGTAAIHYTIDGTAPDMSSPSYSTPLNVQQNTTVRFFSVDNAGNQEIPQTQAVQITPSPVRVSLSWDDGKYALYQVAWLHALQPHGVRSTFNINSGDVGTGSSGDGLPGFMTWANLQELAAAGNEIAGHTVNHINLVSAPDDAARIHQACDDRQTLLLRGLKPTSFAYPEGASNQHVKDIVAGCGYSNARSGGGVTSSGPVYAETVPPLDTYATRTWAVPGGAEITFADLKAAVLAASSHGGGWLQLQGHMVCSQEFHPTDYDDCRAYYGHMELSTLNAFLDWMQNAGQPGGAPAGVTMETVRQVIGPAPSTDVTPPVTTITCNGAPCATADYRTAVTVALNAADGESGVERTLYTIDGSNPVTSGTVRRYTAPFSASVDTTVRFLSLDRAMNVETSHTQRILLDRTAPVTAIACNSAPCSGWYRAPVTVTLTPSDTGGSGVSSTHYTTDGSTPSLTSPTYTGPFQITQTRSVRFASWDVAGNKETAKTQAITLDGAAPSVAVTAPANGATVRRGVARTVSASASDVGTGTGAPSGILRVAWFLDGSSTALRTDTTSPYSFSWNPPTTLGLGTHTLTAKATDVAGNVRTSAPITFTLTT